MSKQEQKDEQAMHTPGPWELSDVREFGRRKVVHWATNPDGHRWKRAIAELLDGNMDEGEPEANARLIAAAPDLLAALKGLRALVIGECGVSTYECFDGERADAAIAKAEGALPKPDAR